MAANSNSNKFIIYIYIYIRKHNSKIFRKSNVRLPHSHSTSTKEIIISNNESLTSWPKMSFMLFNKNP